MTTRKAQLLQLLKESPNDVFLNYALALEYLSENDYEHTQHYLEKTLTLNEQYIPAYYQLGLLLAQLQQKENALQILQKGLQHAQNQKNIKTIAEFQSLITNIENDLL